MLMKFITSGGQKAFFDTLYWALSIGGNVPPEEGLEHPDLPDGTGEFLDSWLLLLEKMVNPKMVLESAHTLPAKTNGSFKPFDPVKYLARTHRLAFHAIMKIWGRKPLKVYGSRMSESTLTILSHILEGEKIIAEKLEKEPAKTSAKSPAPSNPVQQVNPEESSVDPTQLQWLMDMGFDRDRCLEAIRNTDTVDQAADFLLNNPAPANDDEDGSGIAARLQNAASSSSSVAGDQDELMRAIAMSLGENVMVSTSGSGNGAKKSAEAEDEDKVNFDEDFQPLDSATIDTFTDNALDGCLNLLDTLPDSVYRVCDLMLAIFKRNGKAYKIKVIELLMNEVKLAVTKLKETAENKANDAK